MAGGRHGSRGGLGKLAYRYTGFLLRMVLQTP